MKWANYIWSMVERFGASAISLVGNIVLASLLMPDDFGLVAMLGVFTSLVYALIDCGMSDGLLREAAPSHRDFNTLFYFNITVGVVICLIFVALSPLVANVFHRVELQPVMATLGVGAVFSALAIAQATRLRSELRFRQLALINMGAITLALTVAVVMAWQGLRYWALVELQVGFSAFYVLLLRLTSKWHLRWEFDVPRFKQLWQFGANLLLSTIVVQVSQNIVATVLGRHYNATQAGYMGQAQKLQQTPINALEMSVSNATYVQVAKETSPERQDKAYMRVFRLFTLALAMMCTLVMALATPIIDCLFPNRWLPVVPYLRLLLCWAMVYPLEGFLMVLLKLRGCTAVIPRVVVVERIAIIAAALLLWRWGVPVMIATFVAISVVAVAVFMWLCARHSTLDLTHLAGISVGNAVLAGLIALPAYWVCTQLNGWVALFAGLVTWLLLAGPLAWRTYRNRTVSA